MSLTGAHLRRIAGVVRAGELPFVDLVSRAELDPRSAFRGALLRGNLHGQDLGGFDFTGATFAPSCDLTGADLTWTEGVTPEMLGVARTDGNTKLPRAWFWETSVAPTWADDWGRDDHGPWCSFSVPGTEVTQRMRWCPPGAFDMGSDKGYPNERPVHRVSFARGFWMFETACSEALWHAVTGSGRPRSWGPDYPVTTVNWTDAMDFAQRLNAMLPGLSLGLPREAEWEYACRAGSTTDYSFGNHITNKQVCFDLPRPVSVGSLPANAWGFHEMHGNVWEWCEDVWIVDYLAMSPDTIANPASGRLVRVARGGSRSDERWDVRSAVRSGGEQSIRYVDFGFRCVRIRNNDQRSGGGVAAPAERPAPQAGREVADPTMPELGTVARTRGPGKPA